MNEETDKQLAFWLPKIQPKELELREIESKDFF